MIKKLNKKPSNFDELNIDDDSFSAYAPNRSVEDEEEETKLTQELEEFIVNDKKFSNKSTLDIYFNEVNKHKLLSKAEERELGIIINENYTQILTCLCMTENIADFMLQLKETITKTPFNELHKYLDVEYFGHDYKPENYEKLIQQIILLINNFLNIHKAFLNKNKKCISNLQFDKLKGVSKVLNAFSWMQIDRLYLDKLINSIKETVKSTQYYHKIVERCRVNKKKKHEFANKRLMDIEKKFGMKFENILLFIEHIHKFTNEQNKARNKMILANLRLVIFAAHRFYDESLKFSEMLSVGNLGLIKAIERFNFQLSNKFSTYAMWWISHKIIRKIQKAKLIHVPSHLYEELQRFNRLKRKITNMASCESTMNPTTNNANATDEEICKQLNLDIDKIQRAKKESRSVKSLDAQIGDAGSNGVTPSEVLTFQDLNFNKFYEDEHIMQTIAVSSNYNFGSANSEKCMRIANLCKRGIQEQFIKKTLIENNASNNYSNINGNQNNEYENYSHGYIYEDDYSPEELEENAIRSSAANALSIKCKQRYLIQQMNNDKTASGHSNSIRSMFKEIQSMRKHPKLMDFQCMEKLPSHIYVNEEKSKLYKLQLPSNSIDLFNRNKKKIQN